MKKILSPFIIVFIICISMMNVVEGASVSDSFDINNAVTPGNYQGDLTGTVHKTVNFQRENGNNTSADFSLSIDKTVTLKPDKTTGEWFLKSSYTDSPPMDGGWYNPTDGIMYSMSIFLIKLSEPFNETGVSVVSQNPTIVSCTGKVCTALKAGTATVKVSFPNEVKSSNFSCPCLPGGGSTVSACYTGTNPIPATSISGVSHSFKNSTSGYGKFTIAGFSSDPLRYQCYGVTYNFSTLTYTITVPPAPNQNQVSTCTTITNVTTTGATVNWTYSDADNDPQTNYQIQVATDPAFNTIIYSVVAPANTNVSTVRSQIVTNLTPNNTYYTRVRTYNATNLWTDFVSCSSFTTATLPLTATCTPSATSINPNESITWAATASGGTGTYTYSWSGSDGLSGTTNPLTKVYTTSGTKNAAVLVKSGTQTTNMSCPSTVVTSDACNNIGDFQGSVPNGLVQSSGGNCVCGS